ncbi:hypothetical protein [Streptomyces sp. NPDC017964]|uniref:hypothetical protein n=1 Tax=Streptomyces sp. NPDC017964 TaxID=3365022 RepID=UPI0037966A9D
METVVTAALVIAVIAMGIALIHQLNAQHDARIAAYRHSDARSGIGRLRAQNRRAARLSASPTAAPPTVDDAVPGAATDDVARAPVEAAGRPRSSTWAFCCALLIGPLMPDQKRTAA